VLAASLIYKPPNWIDPFDWPAVFGNQHPIEIELGCGKGAFLLWAAQTHPDRNFVGVDRQLARLNKADKKAQRLCLDNVRLVRIEASYFIGKLVPERSVDVVHIYFPDPWPKRRHLKHRLFKTEFVTDLHKTLRNGGAVNVATDDPDYFAHIETVMLQGAQFTKAAPEHLPEEATTEFERIFRAGGKPIYRSRYLRQDQ